MAIALLRVLTCDHRLLLAAHDSQGDVAGERARLSVLLQELEDCAQAVESDGLRQRIKKVYDLPLVRVNAKAIWELLTSVPLPTLYYMEPQDDFHERSRMRSTPSSPYVPPLLKVIAFIDGEPLVCPQVLRPGLMYSLRLRVRGSYWPPIANSLQFGFLSTCPPANYGLSSFSLPKPEAEGEFEADADGNIVFNNAQSALSPNIIFGVLCRFMADDGAGPEAVVIGHDQLQFRVGDLSKFAIASGYKKMDAHVLALLLKLEKSTPAASSEFQELIPVLESLTCFLAVSSQRGVFKGTDEVPEKEFQKLVVDFMRMRLGEEVQEHANQGGGILDVRYRGVIVELKVEKDTGNRAIICEKYTAQPTQYQASESRQVSVLLVLDLTEKNLPPADIRNDILLFDVPTHGGTDDAKPHPSKAFVFVLNGNIRNPSSYS